MPVFLRPLETVPVFIPKRTFVSFVLISTIFSPSTELYAVSFFSILATLVLIIFFDTHIDPVSSAYDSLTLVFIPLLFSLKTNLISDVLSIDISFSLLTIVFIPLCFLLIRDSISDIPASDIESSSPLIVLMRLAVSLLNTSIPTEGSFSTPFDTARISALKALEASDKSCT